MPPRDAVDFAAPPPRPLRAHRPLHGEPAVFIGAVIREPPPQPENRGRRWRGDARACAWVVFPSQGPLESTPVTFIQQRLPYERPARPNRRTAGGRSLVFRCGPGEGRACPAFWFLAAIMSTGSGAWLAAGLVCTNRRPTLRPMRRRAARGSRARSLIQGCRHMQNPPHLGSHEPSRPFTLSGSVGAAAAVVVGSVSRVIMPRQRAAVVAGEPCSPSRKGVPRFSGSPYRDCASNIRPAAVPSSARAIADPSALADDKALHPVSLYLIGRRCAQLAAMGWRLPAMRIFHTK